MATHHGHGDQGSDKVAAFVGLVSGAIVIFAILFGIVQITNHHYESAEGARAEAPR